MLHHGNLKVCQPKNLLLLPILIVFPHQLNGTKLLNFLLIFKGSLLKEKKATLNPPNIIFFTAYELDT